MLMMAVMMGGAGWLMSKLRPGAHPDSRAEDSAHVPAGQQVQRLA
jgi:hypothetical protein